jgi:hypothetical protein
MRLIVVLAVALALPAVAAAAAQPRTVKPDRAAINRLLDEFIPAAVAQKNLQRGWELSAGAARTVSHSQWLKGNTSVQKYPAKGTSFHGWTVSYSYPGDVGFDILLQPTKASLGAWSFRAEAQKLHGQWRITTWYPVATFAPAGKTQTERPRPRKRLSLVRAHRSRTAGCVGARAADRSRRRDRAARGEHHRLACAEAALAHQGDRAVARPLGR